jgi:hypothetical protein
MEQRLYIADNPILHDRFLFYAFPRSNYAYSTLRKSGYAEFVLTVLGTRALHQVPDA